jgi:hypothetical protein
LALDYNVTSLSQGLVTSYPPLFSSNNIVDHSTSLSQDVVMNDYDPFLTHEYDLPTIQPKLKVKKRSYDATRKFQDFWVEKFPWT